MNYTVSENSWMINGFCYQKIQFVAVERVFFRQKKSICQNFIKDEKMKIYFRIKFKNFFNLIFSNFLATPSILISFFRTITTLWWEVWMKNYLLKADKWFFEWALMSFFIIFLFEQSNECINFTSPAWKCKRIHNNYAYAAHRKLPHHCQYRHRRRRLLNAIEVILMR